MQQTIGYLTKRFPRVSETFILDEILGLEALGIPLVLFAIAPPGKELLQPDVEKVQSPVFYIRPYYQRVRDKLKTKLDVLVNHINLFTISPKRYLNVVLYIARKRRHLSTVKHFIEAGQLAMMLKEKNAVHLHAAFAHGPASVAHFVHLLTGIPFSFAGHAKDIYISAPDLLARKITAAEFVLACSKSARDYLVSLSESNQEKIKLISHGVDIIRFSPTGSSLDVLDDSIHILGVGRLVEKKGYPVLLEAISILVEKNYKITCEIIGSGPLKAELLNLVNKLKINNVVSFKGSLVHQQIAQAYRTCDIFVQSSIVLSNRDRDGIPNSLLEAMASAKAVVASAVAGIPEVLPPGCGILVPPDNPQELADALIRLIEDEVLRDNLAKTARSFVVKNYNRKDCIKVVASLFKNQLNP